MKILKAFQHLNPQFKLLGLSAKIQGSAAVPYITEMFRMEISNTHEKYTCLIWNCTCNDFIFRKAKEKPGTKKATCKHQDVLLALYNDGQISETFITEPVFIEEADADVGFDWRNY